eukprot:gnl/Spiro4/1363_TR730_c0_g1_i1.p1 gnl/Spiro4/1363_TR730_c0_g1~~gnl/Spiro4/1363_TR730_c0_g1_i1.p1  ORF type:complete len:505 (+),score=106.22 gnl/Spiro4/1363_TR730_c0_g1_i1:49-1563(+)
MLTHHAHIDVFNSHNTFRRTGIVCTLGPACASVEAISQLIHEGLAVCRFNFSHGTHESHGRMMDIAKAAVEATRAHVAFALDTKGPEIRTGNMRDGKPIEYQRGATLRVSVNPVHVNDGDVNMIYVDYTNLPKVVKVGSLIFVDDGLVELKVLEIHDDYVVTEVQNTGCISNHKGVNLPNVEVDLPAVTEKDRQDLIFGAQRGVDMVFASFVRKPQDVADIRAVLHTIPGGDKIMIISKIENVEGIEKFNSILEVSDGVMVARGDMGIEIPAEKVFLAQKMIISNCNKVGKPVICATQMLDSMQTKPRPTRAEVSDVANAVLDGSDTVMLSGETANGLYPAVSVQMMARIVNEAESVIQYENQFQAIRDCQNFATLSQVARYGETVAVSAVNASFELKAAAIMVLTNTGKAARQISKYRPFCPILAITSCQQTARQLTLSRGVRSIIYEDNKQGERLSAQDRITFAVQFCKSAGTLRQGDFVVCVHSDTLSVGYPNMLRIITVE